MTPAITGLVLLTAGLVLGVGLGDRTRARAAACLLPALLGALALAAAGGAALASRSTGRASLGWLLGDLGGHLVLDPLAATFLLIVFGAAAPACAVILSWAWRRPAWPIAMLGAAANLLLLACGLIVLAGNAFTLALGWELLTAAFYWLAALQRDRPGRPGSAVITAVFGKLSGAALLIGLLLLAGPAHSLDLDRMGLAAGPGVRGTGYALLVLAFAIKVGLVPVQVWLPRGYAAAPGPSRALMAGAAVNVGFYGLWRTLAVLGPPPPWLAVTVLLLGGITALLGVAHATVQTRLAGIVSYSSVENAGLIMTGYGVALIGAATGDPRLRAAGLLAAGLQVIAHAVAKTLLFSATGLVITELGTDDLELVRGVARQLPWTGTALAVGALTMAGLPPTVMFVSEWFTLEALMQQFRLGRLGYTLPLAATGALVALTAGFAAVAFTRLAAFTALGRPGTAQPQRRPDAQGRNGGELGPLGRAGLLALMLLTVGLAAGTPAEIHLLARGMAGAAGGTSLDTAVASPWVLGPIFSSFSVLSPSWLAIELPTMTALVLLVALGLSRGRMLHVRAVPAWRSASGGVDGDYAYTPFGYANPTRRVLAGVLRSRVELRPPQASAVPRPDDSTPHEAADTGLAYVSDVVEITETYLYRPFRTPLRALVTAARRLQSGRLDAYLLYLLLVLAAALAIAAATG